MATSSDKVDFSRLRYEIRKHWWWFIASFAVFAVLMAEKRSSTANLRRTTCAKKKVTIRVANKTGLRTADVV